MLIRNCLISFAFGIIPVAAACSAPLDDAVTADELAIATQQTITPTTAPTILSLEASGDACPADSIATNIAPKGDAATISFSKPLESGMRCKLHFRLKGVPGVRVGLPVAHLRGYRPDGAPGVITTRETLSGSRVTPRSAYRPADHEMDFVNSLARDGERSRTYSDCGRKALDYTLEVSFDKLVKSGGVALDSIDLGFAYFDGAIFRACNNAVLKSAPSKAGDMCGGTSQIACEAGLTCGGTNGDLGSCSDGDSGANSGVESDGGPNP